MQTITLAIAAIVLISGPALACSSPISADTIFSGPPPFQPGGTALLSGRLQIRGSRVEAVRRATPSYGGKPFIGLVQDAGHPWRDAVAVYGDVDVFAGCYGQHDLTGRHNRPAVFIGAPSATGPGEPRRFKALTLYANPGGPLGWR